MARQNTKTGTADSVKGTKPPRPSEATVVPENPIAREMANRVQDEFEFSFGSRVDYEKGSQGISADTVFFHVMIYRSIAKNLAHIPHAPELPEPTRVAARLHGAKVCKLAAGKPVRLVDILTAFYETKDTHCPMGPTRKGEIRIFGPVCEF